MTYINRPSPLTLVNSAGSAPNNYAFPHSASRECYSASTTSQLSPLSAVFAPPAPFEHFTYDRCSQAERGEGNAESPPQRQPRSTSLVGAESRGIASPNTRDDMQYHGQGLASGGAVIESNERRTTSGYPTSYAQRDGTSPGHGEFSPSPTPEPASAWGIPPRPYSSQQVSPEFGVPHPLYSYPGHPRGAPYAPPTPAYARNAAPLPPGHGSQRAEGDSCGACLVEETARHQAIVNSALTVVTSSDPHLYGTSRPYTSQPMVRSVTSFSDSNVSYNFGSQRSPILDLDIDGAYTDNGQPSPFQQDEFDGQDRQHRSPTGSSESDGSTTPSMYSASTYAASNYSTSTDSALSFPSMYRPSYQRRSTEPEPTSPGSTGRSVRRNVFRPSPQSMLAPGVVPSAGSLSSKGRQAVFPGTSNIAAPTDDDFAQMPTKRSRGRLPPNVDALLASIGDNVAVDVSNLHLPYAGLTAKNGKPKKVYICKVPACGKCFKRSEHLKRHVRSIHTDERPFQCQWPSCGKRFTRHDNLSQHLRVHRYSDMDDATFSSLLEQCFGPRERVSAHRQRQALKHGEDRASAHPQRLALPYDEEREARLALAERHPAFLSPATPSFPSS